MCVFRKNCQGGRSRPLRSGGEMPSKYLFGAFLMPHWKCGYQAFSTCAWSFATSGHDALSDCLAIPTTGYDSDIPLWLCLNFFLSQNAFWDTKNHILTVFAAFFSLSQKFSYQKQKPYLCNMYFQIRLLLYNQISSLFHRYL